MEQLTIVERADDRSDRIHQLQVEPFHVARKQRPHVRIQLEEPAVKRERELLADWPHRVERLADQFNLLSVHHVTPALRYHIVEEMPPGPILDLDDPGVRIEADLARKPLLDLGLRRRRLAEAA